MVFGGFRSAVGAVPFTTGNVEMWPPPNCEAQGKHLRLGVGESLQDGKLN